MPVKIQAIQPDSIAEELGILPEDTLVSINGHEIQDELDYLFYQADEKISLVVTDQEKTVTHIFGKDIDKDIGLILYPIKVRKCSCNCIFCFVDQIHPDARTSLKIKDDDYRLSFFHGNFITLSNLTNKDYKRIIEQHLSPLYISVHSTNDELRQKIMRYKNKISILKKLKLFAENGITMHTQIVLIPGWNDGEKLKRSVHDLALLYPEVQSIGIVPVGLTKFRQNLTSLLKVTPLQAKEIIENTNLWREDFLESCGSGIVTLADEFYLLAGESIPETDYYEGFPQIENGIGMVRDFLNTWESYSAELLEKYESKKVLFVTGIAFYPILNELIDRLNSNNNQQWKVLRVENQFLGNEITVAGLLAGCDVRSALKKEHYDVVLLPDEMFNVDGITLDGLTKQHILSV
ncbi:MAG: DUF512 domain-containing protein [Candidatus Cloacimonetes bacterium]|nr:DUF512 domain-containing protein [Candidatus Cloacimonadota bacterium]